MACVLSNSATTHDLQWPLKLFWTCHWLKSLEKGKVLPMVSLALSQLCDLRAGANLALPWPWADSELQTQLSYVGGRPHLSHIRPFRPVPNYTAWWQRHTGVNNLPRSQVRRVTITPRSHPKRHCISHLLNWLKTVNHYVCPITSSDLLRYIRNNSRLLKVTCSWCTSGRAIR